MLILLGSLTATAEIADGLVDPMRPLEFTAAPGQHIGTDLVLTSVMVKGTIKTAVINGERVRERQLVDGAEVISIQPGRVIVRQGNRKQELKVHQSNVKQPNQ